MPSPYRAEIAAAAARHRLSAKLVEAIVWVESSSRADAFRHEPGYESRYVLGNPRYAAMVPRRVASSYGLMQVMYPTAVEEGGHHGAPEYLFVPEVNLEIGCTVLKGLIAWAGGDLRKAIAAWNGGRGNWQGEAPQRYADKVTALLDEEAA